MVSVNAYFSRFKVLVVFVLPADMLAFQLGNLPYTQGEIQCCTVLGNQIHEPKLQTQVFAAMCTH